MMAAMAPAAFPTSSDNFEAYLCLRNSQDFSSVRSGLLRELKSTFVCEGTVEDMKTFGKLGDKTVEEVKSVALKKDVVLSVQSRGGFFSGAFLRIKEQRFVLLLSHFLMFFFGSFAVSFVYELCFFKWYNSCVFPQVEKPMLSP